MEPAELDNLDLSRLLTWLRDDTEQVLELIDEDELLKRREVGELTIANASAKLYEPQVEHQLFAKGIVYTRDPYRLVSLPLVKMFNHGTRAFCDRTTAAFEADETISVVFAEKLDGSLIQCFEWEDEVRFTTRSVLEGDPLDDLDEDTEFPYFEITRDVARRSAAAVLDPDVVRGKTLLLELIHPETYVITRYPGREALVLLGVFDHESHAYWSTDRVDAFADEHGLERAATLGRSATLGKGIEAVRRTLADDVSIPEGVVAAFERDREVVHRVKVKTEEYLRYFHFKFGVNFNGVVEMLWDSPELHDWPAFLAHLREERLTEEEIEASYREHFEIFVGWYRELIVLRDSATEALAAFDENWSGDRDGAYFKALAAHSREHHRDNFPLVMNLARRGELPMDDLRRYHPEPKVGS